MLGTITLVVQTMGCLCWHLSHSIKNESGAV